MFNDTKGKIKRVILMPSIRHCGRRVLSEDVFSDFHKMEILNTACVENILITGHLRLRPIYDAWADLLDKEEHYLIVPIRHPVLVRESFIKRDLSEEEFEKHWTIFFDLLREYNPHYIHVDNVKLRTKEINKISKDLGIKLNTKLGTNFCEKGTDTVKITKSNIKTVPKSFVDFYESTL